MKRRVRIPEGLDRQGRYRPGEVVEFDDEAPRGGSSMGLTLVGYVVLVLVLLAVVWGWA